MSQSVGVVGVGIRGTCRAAALTHSEGFLLAGVTDAVQEQAAKVAEQLGCRAFQSTPALFDEANVVFICAPTRDHFLIAREATRLGKQVFLEWPPATSITEIRTLVRIADEAGTRIGVSCPLLFHPSWKSLERKGSPTVVHIDWPCLSDRSGEITWPHEIAACVAVVMRLSGSTGVRRIDARSGRSSKPAIAAVAFTVQFDNGVMAQAFLHGNRGATSRNVYLAGRNSVTRIDLEIGKDEPATSTEGNVSMEHLIVLEQEAFLKPQREQGIAPLSIAEARQVSDLVERILAKLR